MAKGRAVEIVLDDSEEQALRALIRKHGAPQSLAVRSRIVLAAADGLTNKDIAAKLGVCAHTTGVWRNRFAIARLDGLYDEPRPGAPRQIGDDEVAETIRKTLETRPKGATHWSLRTMAEAVGHSPSTIHRIWQAFGLQPLGNLQTLVGPSVCGEGARHRWSLSVAARACGRCLCRREKPSSGA